MLMITWTQHKKNPYSVFPKGIAGIGNNDFTIWGPDKIYAKDYSSFGLQTPQGGKKKKKKG